MARIAFWAALALGAALVAGCGPAKELPEAPKLSGGSTDQSVAVPAASDPAAKAHLDKVVRAHTGGKPELAAKGRVSRAVFKGKSQLPGEGGLVQLNAVRTVAAVYPDRAHMSDDLSAPDQNVKMQVRVWLSRPRIAVRHGANEFPLPNAAEAEKNLTRDVIAQYWLALGPALADPGAIAFDLRPAPAPAAKAFKLAPPSFPPVDVFTDAADRVARVEYAVTEQGRLRRKVWTLTETRPEPDGLVLPYRFEFRQDNVLVEEWTADKWEFPASIPDSEFAPPKK